MASPQVRTVEVDLSQSVAGFAGMYGLIVGNFDKGPVGKRTFIDGTPKMDLVHDKPGIGSDTAYFIAHTFLSKSQRLWSVRVANGATYGGCRVAATFDLPVGFGNGTSMTFNGVMKFGRCHPNTVEVYVDTNKVGYDNGTGNIVGTDISTAGSTINYKTGEITITFTKPLPNNSVLYARWGLQTQPFTSGLLDPASYMFDDRLIFQEVAHSGKTYSDRLVPDTLVPPTATTVGTEADATIVLYDGNTPVAYADENGILKNIGNIVFVDTAAINTVVYINGEINFTLAASYTPTGTVKARFISYKADAFIIVGDNPGKWTDPYSILIDNVNPARNSFDLSVHHRDSRGVQLKVDGVYTMSREHQRDGLERQMYVEARVNDKSHYIRIFDNLALNPTECLPQDSLEHNNTTARVLTQLAAGTAGDPPTVAQYLEVLASFNNKDDIKIDIVIDTLGDPNYQLAIAKLCDRDYGGRGDCYGVLYTPFALEDSNNYIEDLINYRKYTLNMTSSFVGLYTGHVKIMDGYNGRELWIPNSGFVAAAFAYTADQFEPWFPAAGWRRGILPVLDVYRRFTLGERDALSDNDLNVMRYRAGKGIAIWGQKTLYGMSSALDRANVRWLLIVIENAIEEFLEGYEFEINDNFTRALCSASVNTYLDSIKLRRGLYDFSVVCDSTNNTSEMIDSLEMNLYYYVQPTKSAEYITGKCIITKTGVNFAAVALTA